MKRLEFFCTVLCFCTHIGFRVYHYYPSLWYSLHIQGMISNANFLMVIGVLYLLCREVAEVLCKELEVVS
jgi:hypothetical protein